MASKQTKKIPEEARKAFARELQRLVDTKYEGNQTRAGKALQVTQGHISALLNGERGPGLNVLLLMRLETGKSIDEMLGFAANPKDEMDKRLVSSVEMDVGRLAAKVRELTKELTEAQEGSKTDDEARGVESSRNRRKRVLK